MALSDSIGDFLTRIRNAQLAMMKVVIVPFSRMNYSILKILQNEGYIVSFAENKVRNKIFCFSIKLKYYNSLPVINDIVRVSKPGKRIYFSVKKIPKFYNGLGIIILSTSKGIMSDSHARKLNVGGEILCGIF